jgi:4-hydroxy-tetrahydrodipicolinate reductase
LLVESAKIPTVWSGNYSVGVNLLFALARHAAAVLNTNYDVELVEKHHRFKVDAPSGTAARLFDIIKAERKLPAAAPPHGRTGIRGERESAEVGVHAIRGGDIFGEHTVIFAGLGERVELTHGALDRAIFARGALRATQWIRSRNPGIYDMQDVLGLK